MMFLGLIASLFLILSVSSGLTLLTTARAACNSVRFYSQSYLITEIKPE
jgi:hypothetical protein